MVRGGEDRDCEGDFTGAERVRVYYFQNEQYIEFFGMA